MDRTMKGMNPIGEGEAVPAHSSPVGGIRHQSRCPKADERSRSESRTVDGSNPMDDLVDGDQDKIAAKQQSAAKEAGCLKNSNCWELSGVNVYQPKMRRTKVMIERGTAITWSMNGPGCFRCVQPFFLRLRKSIWWLLRRHFQNGVALRLNNPRIWEEFQPIVK